VSPDIERCYPRTTGAEYESQISFNHGAVNRMPGFRRERADFMCAERGWNGSVLNLCQACLTDAFCELLSQ